MRARSIGFGMKENNQENRHFVTDYNTNTNKIVFYLDQVIIMIFAMRIKKKKLYYMTYQ